MADARIRLQPLSTVLHPTREVHIGWDQALQTYYAHVSDGVDETGSELMTLRVGTGPGEFTEPSSVVNAAARYAEIPDSLADLLNIGRVSTRDTVTDLRSDSRNYQHEQHFTETIARLYRPGGFSTTFTHDQINPVLVEHGWTLADVSAMKGGHVETYHRDGHDLTIPWGWPDQHHDTEQLLSPVTIDGERHGVGSPQELATALAGVRASTDENDHRSTEEESLRDLTQDWHDAVDQKLTVDDLLREEPPDDDLGFGAGLGY